MHGKSHDLFLGKLHRKGGNRKPLSIGWLRLGSCTMSIAPELLWRVNERSRSGCLEEGACKEAVCQTRMHVACNVYE